MYYWLVLLPTRWPNSVPHFKATIRRGSRIMFDIDTFYSPGDFNYKVWDTGNLPTRADVEQFLVDKVALNLDPVVQSIEDAYHRICRDMRVRQQTLQNKLLAAGKTRGYLGTKQYKDAQLLLGPHHRALPPPPLSAERLAQYDYRLDLDHPDNWIHEADSYDSH